MGFFDSLTGGIFGGGGGGGGGGLVGGEIATSREQTTSLSQPVGASEGSLSVGAGGKFVEGPDLTGAHDITVHTTDSGATINALQSLGDVTKTLSGFITDSNANAIQERKSTDDLLRDVLTKLSEQSTAEKTGFASLLISPLFWLVIAGLGVLALYVWRKR